MDTSDFGFVAIGVLGIALTDIFADPSEQVFELGPLRFDPYFAAVGGFGFLVVWGIASAFGVSLPVDPERFRA